MPGLHTQHPDPEKLAAFGLGRLSDADSQEIELHVSDCDECRSKLENSPADSLVSLLQASATQESVNLSGPSADTDSSSLSRESAPPLYKKLAQIIDGKPTEQVAPTQALMVGPAGTLAVKPGFTPPRELEGHPRYLVLEPLGAGGMGTVFKARHRLMERVVALKIVNPQLVTKPGALERFKREVKAAAHLVHPNIVTAYDAEDVGEMHFLVMEFVEGRTLAQVVTEERELTVAKACDYVRQTALGLQYALERGMVHRDIKPQNLMLTPSGSIKILDFGLARFVSEQAQSDGSTEHGSLMGSPDYMAPEQALDAHSADQRADIYSMGCTLYQLLAGQVPFPAASMLAKLEAHRDKQAIALNLVRGDMPAELVKVVEKMMAKDPVQRYQTPAEVAEALRPFTQDGAPTLTGYAQPSLGSSKGSSRKPTWVLAVAALLLLAPLAFLFGPAVYRFATNQGVVIVETSDEDVEVIVKQNGKIIAIIDKKSGQTATIVAGKYEVELGQGKEKLKLSTNEFALSRGGKEIVRVRRDVAQSHPAKVPDAKRRRYIDDVVDRSKANVLVAEDFADPKKSGFGWGEFAQHFKDGRIYFHDGQDPIWSTTGYRFDEFVCEVTASIVTPPHRGWGIGILDIDPEKKGGLEVVLDSNGELHIVPTRLLLDKSVEIPSAGPIRVTNFRKGDEQNSLTVIVRGGRTVEVFVNGIEACDPIILERQISPVQVDLASRGGNRGSVLAFESFKVWRFSAASPPPSVEELLKAREVLTVAQDGSAGFKTIGEALDKVQQGQVVLVKDKGPYREFISKSLPADVALVSLVGTRIEIPKYTDYGPGRKEGERWYFGAWLNAQTGLRLSGFEWVATGPRPENLGGGRLLSLGAGGDVVVEGCTFRGPDWLTACSCFRFGSSDKPAQLVFQDNVANQGFEMLEFPGSLTFQRNWISASDYALLLNQRAGSVVVRHNVLSSIWGITFVLQLVDKVAPGVDVTIHNNVLDVGDGPIGFANDGKAAYVLPRSARIVNNIFRSRANASVLMIPPDMERVKDRFVVGPNAYQSQPKKAPQSRYDSWPTGPRDLIMVKQFLSADPKDTDYLRISADNALAKGGAGSGLPTYFGAFPPGPAPKDGDWFTRLQDAAKRSPAAPSVKDLLARARAAGEQKQFEQVVSACTEVLRLEPGNIEATYLRAWPQWNLGKREEAIQDVSAVLKLDPDYQDARPNRSFYYLNMNRFDECIADADFFLAKHKTGVPAAGMLGNRGGAWALKGRFEKGLADFEMAAKLDPTHAVAHQWQGMILTRLGEPAKAKVAFDAAVKLDKAMATYGKDRLDHVIPQPTPLAEWRIGREFLTVAQTGPADHRTIQDALNAVKPGQYVKVLDKGPYRETILYNAPIADIALVSDVATRIEVPKWHEWGNSPLDPKKKVYQGFLFVSPQGLRLSGFEFRMPPLPPDVENVVAVDFASTGEFVIDSCQVRFHRDVLAGLSDKEKEQLGRFIGLNIGLNSQGTFKKGRFLLQDSLVDGKVQVHGGGPLQMTVQRNWIRAGPGVPCLDLPSHAQTEGAVRHNVMQGNDGIAMRARGPEKTGSTGGRYVIANNLIDVAHTPTWAYGPVKGEQDRKTLVRAVAIQNNIVRSRVRSGLQLHADDLKLMSGVWKVGHNCFGAEPIQVAVEWLPIFAKQPTDLVVAGPFLSEDPKDGNYLRIAADSKLAASGVGGVLPSYIGPLPPGPAPKEGDWLTRLRAVK